MISDMKMNKLLLIICLVFLTGVCSFAQETDISYKFTENAHHKFREKVTIDSYAKIMDEEKSSREEYTQDIDEVILGGGDVGKVKQTITLTASVTDGESSLDKIPEDRRRTELTFEETAKGKILSLSDENGKTPKDFDPKDEKSLFPDGKVKIGDTWVWARKTNGLELSLDCTLLELYSENGVDVAKIGIKEDETVSQDNIDFKVTGSGVFYFAVNYGNDLYLKLDLEFYSSIPIIEKGTEKAGEASINNKYSYMFWRCD